MTNPNNKDVYSCGNANACRVQEILHGICTGESSSENPRMKMVGAYDRDLNDMEEVFHLFSPL